jgi:serine/threonine protein kinase
VGRRLADAVGAMQVFHAKLKKNNAELAVKVMDQSFIRKENKTAFVITERKVMSRLHHPNIVRFYCSFKVDSTTPTLGTTAC